MGRSDRESICGRCLRFICTLVLWGVAGYAIWYYLGKPTPDELIDLAGEYDFGDFNDVLDNFTGFDLGWDNDPFLSSNDTDSWRTNGQGGLELTLVNALNDDWYDEFDLAVIDWETGIPDALTLSTEVDDVDNSCKPIDGKMKVCNGNYGDTGWLGINELLTNVGTGFIISSAAKMNEFYLHNADEYSRQYTMCHEIGHGFGLPHTDESFTNPDLGNCMDYTKTPQNNLHPDQSNYNRLQSLYGTVNRRKWNIRRSLFNNEQQQQQDEQQKEQYELLKPSQDVLRNYKIAIEEIEQNLISIDNEISNNSIQDSIQEEEENEHIVSSSGWRRLSQHSTSSSSSSSSSTTTSDGSSSNTNTVVGGGGAHYRRHLGEGYHVVVHVLYAN